MAGLLSKERIVAGPRFNRWWNVVAALAINLSIGQAYAFSVFNLPLTRVVGITESAPEDWKLTTLGWIFSIAIVFLGLSAAVYTQTSDVEGEVNGLLTYDRKVIKIDAAVLQKMNAPLTGEKR